jgi:hypothetical protein
MKNLIAVAIIVIFAAPAHSEDFDIQQQQRQMQSDYDAAHPGNQKACVTAFYAQSGEFVGFRTVPDGDQYVIRGSREIGTCQNGRQIASQAIAKATASSEVRRRGSLHGQDQPIDYFYSLYPDCSSMGYPTISIITPPQNGAITATDGEANPVYAKDNERAVCNLKKAPVTFVHYAPKPGYRGGDRATVEVLFPLGSFRTIEYVFDVR